MEENMTEVTRARPIDPPIKRNWLMAAVATARAGSVRVFYVDANPASVEDIHT